MPKSRNVWRICVWITVQVELVCGHLDRKLSEYSGLDQFMRYEMANKYSRELLSCQIMKGQVRD